jgi:RNA polymerase sigma-70 factor (ECF subfamily)
MADRFGKPQSADDAQENAKRIASVSVDSAEAWVDEHADALYRFAMLRVRNRTTAEDLVQETFLAAVKSKSTFQGGSQRRTWLIGILRHKISDHFRATSRQADASSDDGQDDILDRLFDERGHWRTPPKSWNVNPEELAQRKEFWLVLRGCVDALPAKASEAFALRVIEDTEPDEVCKALTISSTNLWVLLHRARSRLRECLEKHWFASSAKEPR